VSEYPLGLSTSWNAAGLNDGREIVEQIKGLGFRAIEVEYRVSSEAVAGIKEAVDSGDIQVLSVHNYTPLAAGEEATSRGGDKRNLASPVDSERREAVWLTLRSLELARKLGARALVLHLGETDISRDYFGDLARVVEEEGVGSRSAEDLRWSVRVRRDIIKSRHLKAAMSSLRDLLPFAQAAGIVLGIENRYYFHQVPLPEEIPSMLDELRSPFVRYWHDVGHAYVMEALGFTSWAGTMEDLVASAFGVHVHDSVFIRDHKAPGTGEIPLHSTLRLIPDEAIKILELASTVPRADIVDSIPLLESFGLSL